VDEAQMILDHMTMEEIRLLLNFQQDRRFMLTLFLVGQPELLQKVEDMPQLQQRLSIRFHIGPLEEEESFRYMGHRLHVAGVKQELFTRDAEKLIASAGEGVPRKINNLADMALLVGYGQHSPVVDEDVVRKVVADMTA
jgi:general secretion pathway protein A